MPTGTSGFGGQPASSDWWSQQPQPLTGGAGTTSAISFDPATGGTTTSWSRQLPTQHFSGAPGTPQAPSQGTASSAPPASGGVPPAGGSWNQGGGWNEGQLSPAAQALQSAFAKGLTGQAAVDDANTAAGLRPPNSISFGDGGYGLPGGQYVAPNAAKGGQLDLITRGGGGGGGGGDFSSGGGGYGNLTSAPGTFQAPSGLTPENDPGYLARMKMGTDAIQASAAAKGSLLSGGTLKALERYGQDYGSNEYGNIYGRALAGYQTNVGTQRNAQQDYWTRLQDLHRGTGQTPPP